MDTGTHIAMGVALSGLALIDPVVASQPTTYYAVVTGVMVGSLIPDVDTVLKLKNNAVYIQNHRGITHSIPAVLLWPILITVILSFIFSSANLTHVLLWSLLAVFLHVFVDLFNSYGTQALRPFSKKWVALSVINTFDPIIFAMHLIAFSFWWFGTDPVWTMLILLGALIVYYITRFALKRAILNAVRSTLPDATDIFIAPTMRFFQWRVAASSPTKYYVGRAYGRSVNIYDEFDRAPLPTDHPAVQAAMTDPNIQVFMGFSPTYRWEMERRDDGCTEVRLIDLRYRSKGYYPFVAVAHVDDEQHIHGSYTGWIFSEEKLQQKIANS